MNVIKQASDFENLINGNRLCGVTPNLYNSTVQFLGQNNILYCEEGVNIKDSTLCFNANNSVIYLGKNRNPYRLNVSCNNDCVFHMGKDNYINQKITIVLSEQKHCYIGDDGIFAWGICIRNADPHLVYSCENNARLNPTKSVFIGDHVWIGQNVTILKGTEIDSGSIIGAMSLVTGKKIGNNQSWGGVPCRKISEEIFWDGACVHSWTETQTELSQDYFEFTKNYNRDSDADKWKYTYVKDEILDYSEIDRNLSEKKSSEEKLEYLLGIENRKKKNRFVHNVVKEKTIFLGKKRILKDK